MIHHIRSLYATLLEVTRRLDGGAPLLARVCVGLVFTSAGAGKLRNLEQTVAFFESLGIPAPELQAPFVAATELGGGLLLIAGLATRLAALPLAATMVVAIATALWSELEGAVDLFGRSEFLLGLLLVWLVLSGPGRFSLDALVARRASERPS